MADPEIDVAFLVFQWLRGRIAVCGENESGRALRSALVSGEMTMASVLSGLLDPDERDLLLLHQACIDIYGRRAEQLEEQQVLQSAEVALALAAEAGEQKAKFHIEWQHVFNLLDEFIVRVGPACSELSYPEFLKRAHGPSWNEDRT